MHKSSTRWGSLVQVQYRPLPESVPPKRLTLPAGGRQCGPEPWRKTVSTVLAREDPPHMPRLTKKLPSYRLHKPSGQAIVSLDGKDFYLGVRLLNALSRRLIRLLAARVPPHGLSRRSSSSR